MILAGDIGGTKTNLALYEQTDSGLELRRQQQFASSDFATLIDAIAVFCQEEDECRPTAACFGIAGPVINGHCRATNLPWEIETAELQEYLRTDRVRLINDLEATAYGMLHLKEEDFVQLNPYGVAAEGNRAVIAAGTGLGEAMLYYDGSAYHPVASEGGHSDFAPSTPQQDALLLWLRKRYPDHVSYERILSGPGIYTLYEFLLESGFAPEPARMRNIAPQEDRSAMVSRCAIEDNDPLCTETLRLFVEIYGAEAGNLALKTLSLGGLYIGGGIAPKILPFLEREFFMQSFTQKGRFAKMLGSMQVKVSLNPDAALFGAAYFAVDAI
jgi:glucokinase